MIVYPINTKIGNNVLTLAVVTDIDVAHELCYSFCKASLKDENRILQQENAYFDKQNQHDFAIAWFTPLKLNNFEAIHHEIEIIAKYT